MLRFIAPAVLLAAGVACGGGGGGAAGEGDGAPSGQALVERGRQLYQEEACVSCHSVDGSSSVGPTWQGLYEREVTLSDGTTVVADEEYLTESMLQPSARTVEGYSPGLMESVIKPDSLTAAEVDALIAYIRSLS